jgi:mannosyltransferase OCH1-like enzyme
MNTVSAQSYANHKRRQPVFHFFVIPVLITNFILAAVYLVRHPGLAAAWMVILSVVLLIVAFLTRVNAMRVQDRLIRLEERLRLTALLPEPTRENISQLTAQQLVALRFASDAEIPRLVDDTLKEKLGPKEIKKRIQSWRPDHFRV